MIFLQNCEDIAPRSEAIWKSWIFVYDLILPAPFCPPALEVFRIFSSHQAPRPPAVRRTHSFLHLFLGALHHLIPSTGYTNSVAHWTSEKVRICITLLPWHSWLWQLEGVVIFAAAQFAACSKSVHLNNSFWQLLTRSCSVGWVLS